MKLKLQAAYGLGMHIPNIKPQPVRTRGLFEPQQHSKKWGNKDQYKGKGVSSPCIQSGNAQTDRVLSALGLPHIWTVPSDTESNLNESIPEMNVLAMFSSELTGKRKLLSLPSPIHTTDNDDACGLVNSSTVEKMPLPPYSYQQSHSKPSPPPLPLVIHNNSIVFDNKSSDYGGWYPPLPLSPPPSSSCESKPLVEDPNALDI